MIDIILSPCECCGKPSTPIHHKFNKTTQKKVGTAIIYKDLIDHPDNKQFVCSSCNGSHSGHGKGLIVWSEKQFCEHFNIVPRSKSGLQQYKRVNG